MMTSVTSEVIEELLGKRLVAINYDSDEEQLILRDSEKTEYIFYHDQNCCEGVYLAEISGSLLDLYNEPIIKAEVRTSEEDNADEYQQWTFYELATNKGSVTLRWYGHSNGYYSVDVSLQIKKKNASD